MLISCKNAHCKKNLIKIWNARSGHKAKVESEAHKLATRTLQKEEAN